MTEKLNRKLQILFIFILAFKQGLIIQAQNLVPNPSFEEYTVCPDNYFMLPTSWYSCSADPDYYNSCDSTNSYSTPYNGFGYQLADDGRAYCGFYALNVYETWFTYKEYLGCELITPLVIGQKYYISFKINFSDNPAIDMATSNIGLLFSTISYQDYQPYDSIYNNPTNNFAHIIDPNITTDTLNWTTIKGSIIADSAYQYLLIGNFFDIGHSDTILLNNNYYYHRAYYFIDEVCVSTDSLTCNSSTSIRKNNINKSGVNIFPNPTINKITIVNYNNLNKEIQISIFNINGRQIMSSKFQNENSFELDVHELLNGIYILKIQNSNTIEYRKLIKQ